MPFSISKLPSNSCKPKPVPSKGLVANCSAETLQNSKRVSIVSGALDVNSFYKRSGERLATNMAPKNIGTNNKKIFL